MPRTLKCTAILLGLFIPSIVNAAMVEDFPGLEKLIRASDAIVILKIERPVPDFYRRGSYSTHECYIYQTLKGDIAQNCWLALELMDKRYYHTSPYVPGSVHLMFLLKKEKQNELAKYRTVPFNEAHVSLLSPGHVNAPQEESIELKIRALIKKARRAEKRQYYEKKAFLQTMLDGPKENKPKPGDFPEGLLEMVKQGEVDFEDCQPQHLVKITQALHRSRDHSKVIQAGKTTLQMSLPAYEDATVRFYMAQSYESLQKENGGPLAKQKYREILEMHPEYERNIEVAERLAELNDSIIMHGTERNPEEAAKWYRYVIDRYTKFDTIYYEVLKAHMGMGTFLWDRNDYDGAKRHFETLYQVDPDLMKPLLYMYCEKDYDIDEKIEWLRDRAISIQKISKEKLVNLCVRSGLEESIDRLEKLQEEYASDTEIVDLANKRMLELNQIRH